jgi:magnesium-transporting ATPase (P-type)
MSDESPQTAGDVVLVHLNRGASQFGSIGSQPNSRHESLRLGDIHRERRKQQTEGPAIPQAEIESEFHSARNPEHRLSKADIGDMKASNGLDSVEAQRLLARFGPNELVENKKPCWKLLSEQFTGPMPIAIWIGIVVEASLENWLDANILLTFQCLNGSLGFFEANKADNAIAALKVSGVNVSASFVLVFVGFNGDWRWD